MTDYDTQPVIPIPQGVRGCQKDLRNYLFVSFVSLHLLVSLTHFPYSILTVKDSTDVVSTIIR
jgi:hypothetical protein